jgi:hypothetical protein
LPAGSGAVGSDNAGVRQANHIGIIVAVVVFFCVETGFSFLFQIECESF